MPRSEQVLEILQRYVAAPMARGMLRRATDDLEGMPEPTRGVQRLVAALEPGIRTFVRVADQTELMLALAALDESSRPPPGVTRMPICDQRDVRKARMKVREMVAREETSPLVSMRCATALSELTRNILRFAGTGEVELELRPEPRRLRIVATDQGPGIGDVDSVLGGEGGLANTRDTVERFDLRTGDEGTRVEVEIHLS